MPIETSLTYTSEKPTQNKLSQANNWWFLFKIDTTDVLFFYILGKKENIKKLDLKQQDMTICTEFLIKSYRNFKCKEILPKERKRLSGVSKVNKVFEGLKIFGNILKLYVQ